MVRMLLGLLEQGAWKSWRRGGTQVVLEGWCLLVRLCLLVLKWRVPALRGKNQLAQLAQFAFLERSQEWPFSLVPGQPFPDRVSKAVPPPLTGV